jgi:hypothetical protein
MSEQKPFTDTKMQELEALKQHNNELSDASGEIHIAGALRDIAPQAVWHGKVSIKERLESGSLTHKDVEDGFELVNGFYVPASPRAIMRCGDERGEEDYDDDNLDDYLHPLGPQTLGGDIAVANALWIYRLIKDPNYEGDITDMFGAASGLIRSLGYSSGVHGDNISGKAGCGAAKTKSGQLMIIGKGDAGFSELVAGYVGDRFDGERLRLISDTVEGKIVKSGMYIPGPKELVNEALKFNPQGYVSKNGPHLGLGVVKNDVEETTLHINHLNAVTGGKLSFFNVDGWFDIKIAEAITSDKNDQLLIEHIRAAQTISTAMMLKDGSLFFGARLPKAA